MKNINKRIRTSEVSYGYFEINKAKVFYEKQNENENENKNKKVGLFTKNTTEHEKLYRTRMGKWILHSWSEWLKNSGVYDPVSEKFALEWLVKNDYDLKLVKKEIEQIDQLLLEERRFKKRESRKRKAKEKKLKKEMEKLRH